MPQPVLILFGALFAAAVSIALGKLLLRELGLELRRFEEEALAFVAGSALLSGLIFALAAVKLARKGVFLVLGAALIGLAVYRGAHRLSPRCLSRIPRLYAVLLWGAIAIFGVVYLANAMAPEKSPDGSGYHLGFVGRFDRAHGFERIETNMYAHLSLGAELLFLWAYSFGRHSAASTLHLCFLFALVATMVSYGRRFGFAQAGVAGALFFFLSPVVGVDATSAYNDVALASVLFALFYLLQLWDEDRRLAWTIPIGLLSGFAYAIKYTGFIALPYAAGFLLWRLWRARKPLVKPVAIVAGCALLLIVPWIAKNWIWLGNPFSPFLNSVFPNPYVHISFEKDYAKWMSHYEGLKAKQDIPLEITVRGRALGGMLGPLFLLSPLALLSVRGRAGRRLLFAAAVFALTYPANVGTRFLIPPWTFVSMALAIGLSQAKGLTPLLIAAHGILAWPPVLSQYAENVWRIEKVPHKAALRIVPEEEFLAERLDGYKAARLIDDFTPERTRVFSFSALPEAYASREIVTGYQSAPGELIRDILLTPLVEDFPPLHHFDSNFPVQKLRRIRIRQITPSGIDLWSITEVRAFAGGNEIAKERNWQASARPNRWDAGLALDRNPATRWRSWQALDAAMYYEVDFGRALDIDMVRVEASSDQYQAAMALEAMDESGAWKSFGNFPDRIVVKPPGGLRRAAVAAVRARGVDYLLVLDHDFAAKDMRERAAEWGMTQIGERGVARLYKLD